ncbi:MAG: hypothetical protein ACI9WU_000647 [Myxococcota bacterium]
MFDPEIAAMQPAGRRGQSQAPQGAAAKVGASTVRSPDGGPPLAARFAGDPLLQRLFVHGGFNLDGSHNGPAVQLIQQALIDMGYPIRNGATGRWDAQTAEAVKNMQTEAGLSVDARFGQGSLRVLSQRAPAARGSKGRQFDWERLLADQKLEIVAGFGYDKNGVNLEAAGEVIRWLTSRGFRLTGREGRFELYGMRHPFKLTTDSGVRTVPADVTVKLVTEGTGAKDAFLDGMANSEVVSYTGHARYGMGMDFDAKESSDEQVVIGDNSAGHRSGQFNFAYNEQMRDVTKGQQNDLEQMSANGEFQSDLYQVMALNGCSTANYMDEMRGGLMKGKDTTNLDMIGTRGVVNTSTSGRVVISFLAGMLRQSSADRIVQDMGEYDSNDRMYFAEGMTENGTRR